MKRIVAYKGLFQEFVSKLSVLEQQKIRRALALLKQDEKTPRKEIEKALKLKKEYYESKRNQ